MPISNTIALIFDFDDTLGNDTISLLLKEKLNMNPSQIKKFWNEDAFNKIKKGWDPPLAYIDVLLQHLKKKDLKIKNSDLRELGKKVILYPGVETLFQRLRSYVQTHKRLQEGHVRIEFYIISGSFYEMIKGTSIGNEIDDIFASTFFERNGLLIPKSTITFTEKTKFLFAINKGISGRELHRNPYSVNDVISETNRRIPFKYMIYLGDGPSDIPCFSAIQKRGGTTIGILKYQKKKDNILIDKRRAWAFAKGSRQTLGPYLPTYEENSDLYQILKFQVERIGFDIVDAFARARG